MEAAGLTCHHYVADMSWQYRLTACIQCSLLELVPLAQVETVEDIMPYLKNMSQAELIKKLALMDRYRFLMTFKVSMSKLSSWQCGPLSSVAIESMAKHMLLLLSHK